MDKVSLLETRNFREVDHHLSTAGQPNEAQLASAARDGFQVVINLGLHTDPRYALADERACVESLGMTYVHIPVEFGAPTEADLTAFFEAMDANEGRRVLVHCAANMRVTAFVGLYRAITQGRPRDEAFAVMRSVWEPNAVWADFIRAMLDKHGGYGRRSEGEAM